MSYFGDIGFPCGTYQNPAEYFLKIMTDEKRLAEEENRGNNKNNHNKEIKEEKDEDTITDFDLRLQKFVDSYNNSPLASKK